MPKHTGSMIPMEFRYFYVPFMHSSVPVVATVHGNVECGWLCCVVFIPHGAM
jgi:hypothetical protein